MYKVLVLGVVEDKNHNQMPNPKGFIIWKYRKWLHKMQMTKKTGKADIRDMGNSQRQ